VVYGEQIFSKREPGKPQHEGFIEKNAKNLINRIKLSINNVKNKKYLIKRTKDNC
jgi:hypothetical protein